MKSYLVIVLAALCTLATVRGGTPILDDSKTCQPPVRGGVGPYISLFGGANVHQTVNEPGSMEFDSQVAWFGGAKAGYAFHGWGRIHPAVELDVSYVRNDLEFNDRFDGTLISARYRLKRELDAIPIMMNGILKYDLGRFQPYLGAGVGVAHVRLGSGSTRLELEERNDPQIARLLDIPERSVSVSKRSFNNHSQEWSFAAQGIAGLEYSVTPRVGVYVEYKALWLRDADDYKDLISHLVGGGVRLYF